MGRAGQALRHTLEQHKISQNKLAVTMGIDRPKVHRWYHEKIDPTAETVVGIVLALNKLDSEAAKTFLESYLGELINNPSQQ
ncbi:helix-turn-helix domain-containing protein [Spirulina major]|uniref:helix-turn-helix domain-containing protein n=2 Tax=Spirulinaceae TaxID=1890448 RepID=UPI00232BF4A3|nr:helix-turn-helix transcriptional regulator [Spirulina major]